jgi:CheY-like chemotaxis protein
VLCQQVAFAERAKRPHRGISDRKFGPATAPGKEPALVLVVDDEVDAVEFLGELLRGDGFRFVSAGSGAEALVICRDRHPDLAIVDVMMPGMTGFELCDLLRSDVACRDIPIIVYSAHDTKPYSNTGLYDVAFVKPADAEELLHAVRTLLPAEKLPPVS